MFVLFTGHKSLSKVDLQLMESLWLESVIVGSNWSECVILGNK